MLALSRLACYIISHALTSHCRYEHALNKANYASLALRPDSVAGEDDGAAQEDDDLYQSLNK
jgi:hypothetical protein